MNGYNKLIGKRIPPPDQPPRKVDEFSPQGAYPRYGNERMPHTYKPKNKPTKIPHVSLYDAYYNINKT